MQPIRWSGALPLVLVLGCASPSPGAPDEPEPGAVAPIPPSARASHGVVPACSPGTAAPGEVLWAHAVGEGSVFGPADLAVDAGGDPLYARPRAALTDDLFGLTKLASADGAVLSHLAFGKVVAADRDGNTFVADLVDVSTETALGPLPSNGPGDVRVVLAKLDAQGRVVWVQVLGGCGQAVDVISVAVAADGRIAVSGPGLGSEVLGPTGELLWSRPFVGDLAFDHAGDLIATGALDAPLDLGQGVITPAGGIDAFIVKLDPGGSTLWTRIISDGDLPVVFPDGEVFDQPGRQAGTAVAVDPDDNILVIGEFDVTANLFGTQLRSGFSPEQGVLPSGYLAKLDPWGAPIWDEGILAVEAMADVASDPAGDVLVSGAATGNVPPFRIAFLDKRLPGGQRAWQVGGPQTGYGSGLGVGTDACGNVFWATGVRDTFDVISTFHSYVEKLAP